MVLSVAVSAYQRILSRCLLSEARHLGNPPAAATTIDTSLRRKARPGEVENLTPEIPAVAEIVPEGTRVQDRLVRADQMKGISSRR